MEFEEEEFIDEPDEPGPSAAPDQHDEDFDHEMEVTVPSGPEYDLASDHESDVEEEAIMENRKMK